MLLFYYIGRYIHSRRAKTSIETFSRRFYLIALIIFILFSDLSALGKVGSVLTLGKAFWYMQYFALGVLCHCHKESFERLLDNGKKMAIIVLSYFIVSWWLIDSDAYIAQLNPTTEPILDRIMPIVVSALTALVGYFGIMMVWGIFRRYGTIFSESRYIGKPLQFVGRNTLDVYLIHYFVLINFTTVLRPYIVDTNNVLVQIIVGVATAAAIVGVSLLISRIIRVSDYLAYYLLGARDVKLTHKQ
jgi:peptidoglycan/LPS O-acetylase OafA/YrhL